MISPITSNHIAANISDESSADKQASGARLQLAFIAALFATSWIIGSVRMGDVISANSHSVSLLGTLIGM